MVISLLEIDESAKSVFLLQIAKIGGLFIIYRILIEDICNVILLKDIKIGNFRNISSLSIRFSTKL